MALLAGAISASACACGAGGSTSGSAAALDGGTGTGGSARPSAASSPSPAQSQSPSASPSPTRPSGPPLLLDSLAPADSATVGVAMPVSIVFTHPVAAGARKAVEQHLQVSSSVPVTGAWHWFSNRRVDWRPEQMWPTGAHVTVDAALDGVGDGNGRYGTHDYHHSFTIGDAVKTTVDVPGHSMKVYRNGSLVRTMPIDAGSPSFPSWDGTMAVLDKERSVRMTSCSVGITCDRGNPNFYDLTLPWDVHLTYSGTYVHYSTGDPQPGHSYGSHGCVHLSLANAKWYYDYVKQGDPVTITGSPRGKAAADNGYAAFNLSWSQWL
ncbi:L,D-transpeptidase, partial [Streptacidiphilus griseoplanus]|uniref:L,D-transpeptidase n=1 Tax=Peterkaempfera griseoplana TaxID=66896 RepID=UPI000AC06364